MIPSKPCNRADGGGPRGPALLILSLLVLTLLCGDGRLRAGGDSEPFPVQFENVTRQAGLSFQHNNGAFGKKYLPETMGSGAAFLDYNNDDWQDILLINGKNWPGRKGSGSTMALYHNNQDGTFSDVTRKAGLNLEIYGMGCAAGDYDNDGWVDLYVSALGPDRLFRNQRDGTFRDVTRKAGLGNPEFATSVAWLDYDRDGNLDLLVTNYVEWSIETDIRCSLDGVNKSYCTPESYPGVSSRLYRNRGDGTFADVTREAGLLDSTSKALGVAVFDAQDDGWPDLLLANDTQPNKLYINRKDGTFRDEGISAGVAFSEDGTVRGAMGVDAADYDGSGLASLVIGNFSNEMLNLYHNEGQGLFVDDAPTSEVGQSSLLTLAFACFFFDFDLDGKLDIFVANGHVENDINKVQRRVKYAQPPHLFHNQGKGFVEVAHRVGTDFRQRRVGRGGAYGDYDNDGDLDLLMSTNGGPAVLWENQSKHGNRFLRVKTVGTSSNRDGIGAKVTVQLADGRLWRRVKSGSSYCSQSELPVTFGLGRSDRILSLEVLWPSGSVDKLSNLAPNQRIVIREGKGLVKK
ncbi:MAG: CRTAC1 family protein [Acidobacteria bacterium]|nr:CRTAC1 family protein [Acidobacteriota bacterium]